MNRLRIGVMLFAGLALITQTASAAPANHAQFAGTWTMDGAKSQVNDGRTVDAKIELTGDVLKYSGTVKKGGGTATEEFSCDTASGKDCVFEEAGHKSKVVVYFNGPVLNFCKTDGPASDAVSEWKLELSPDGNTLTATITHIDPAAKDEMLVFVKK